FRARFVNGYGFFTGTNIGVYVQPGGNSWVAFSDVRFKENFIPVDGEKFLKSIANMPQYTWNYKTQDPKTFRHYGPMAQDFYKAFGRDKLGEIGCDTTINQQDFLGVSLIAIQALEKRTTILQQENDALKEKNELLEERLIKLEGIIKKN
ncbi:MAG: tail fiber domain-containing protein, partial [Ferruginibacter sp.]